MKWRCGENHHPWIFQLSDGGTNRYTPPGAWYCFWFTFFPGRGRSSGLHLAFPTMIALTLQDVGIFPVAKYVYSHYAFQNWANNQRMGLGTHWVHCEMDLS